ncbi:DUF4222 domain-containing protein [Salmonella enterica]|uniref:DUF4222 domain-containing protein n=1 Tax=Salmonella enterica TaxID=28901 RepID=UPI0012716B78|nr:DUF4222 domain-containing protein [Salmonella enterica subsp. diarizonae]EHE8608853.1 DUF4222 domain-containing protein [Salmonella enterica subsp. enterica serovar 4,[5],12:b:-]EIX3161900.1 DUF4222 domain-containing protein [Salmonella enterica]ECI3368062.1 DUF4222 domain-containing protein [Salmonella enterica subsp. diarizonae]ECI4841630.1 DUF4222 domain-containing protein [Salmonella enterica subsp. diarizonae]
MRNFDSGFTASGRSQPEIMPGCKWRDGHGEVVTIKNHSFNRVKFIREGYEFPCTQPVQRFLQEFTSVEVSQ